MPQIKQDRDTLPLYGSVTGITLPSEQIHVARGVALRRAFSTPMMGFAEPASGYTRSLGSREWLCVPKFRFCNIDCEGRRERVVM